MIITANIIADSICFGQRLTTFELYYPKFIHAEVMTHRAFSRNGASSRAIPTAKFAEIVKSEMVAPFVWTENRPGMNGEKAQFPALAEEIWNEARNAALSFHEQLIDLGIHKQNANRLLEPFFPMRLIVSSTNAGLENFFNQRCHPDAQPEIQILARTMRFVYENKSTPEELYIGAWHLPYVTQQEREELVPAKLCLISAARCARVSYNNQDKKDIDADLALAHKLLMADPPHLSPFEHVATPINGSDKNFDGWRQYRTQIEKMSEPLRTWIVERTLG